MTKLLMGLVVAGMMLVVAVAPGPVAADIATDVDFAPVPEPSPLVLLAAGGAVLGWWLQKRRK